MSCQGDCSCAKRKRPNEPVEDKDDEIWLSSGDEEHFTPMNTDKDDVFGADEAQMSAHVDTLALRRVHGKQGFAKGVAEARLKATQTGFDHGYENGSSIGLKVGQIISGLHILTLCKDEKIAKDARSLFEQLKSELYIANVLNHKYFDSEIELVGLEHELVSKWETIVVRLELGEMI